MILSPEACIAIAGLGLALPSSLAIVLKCRESRLRELAASQDIEMQVVPSTRPDEQPEVQALPAPPPPALTRVPLNTSTRTKLYEPRHMIIVDMCREIASRLSSSQDEGRLERGLSE